MNEWMNEWMNENVYKVEIYELLFIYAFATAWVFAL